MTRKAFWIVAVVLAVTPQSFAQTVAVAQLSGNVADESGGSLPGVEVIVTQTNTGMTRFAITDQNGGYVLTNLPVGPYKLSAKLSGFSALEQTGIVLAVGESRSVNVTLKIGALSETISVQADATSVETRKVSVANVVDEKQIEALPLAGRQVLQLLLISGSAVDNNSPGGSGGSLTDNRQPPNAVAISVAGGTGNSTLYLVDGGYNNDPQANTGNAMPFPDALQQFSVESGARDARFGGSSSGTVNAVTKAGTNEIHGNAFGYGRNAKFNSLPYFTKIENGGTGIDDGLKRLQVGGTFGGPVIKDRLFVFGGLQITSERITPVESATIVPTAAVRAGDFRQVMSAACRGGTARTLGLPYVNNQVDPGLYHPISLKLMSMLPLPDPAYDPDGCGRYNNALPNDSNEQQYVVRVDNQMTTDIRVFGRYFRERFLHSPLFNAERPNLLEASTEGTSSAMDTFAGGFDYVVSPHLFASTRIAYSQTSSLRLQGDGLPSWVTFGVKTWTWTNGNGDFLGGGTAGWPANAATGAFYAWTPSFSQDFDLVLGSHSISFGGSWTRPHSDGDGRVSGVGNFTFSGLVTSGTTNANGGLNLADWVLGYPASYSNALPQLPDIKFHQFGAYIGDVWRASRRVTINAGIRWEPYLAVEDLHGFYIGYNRERYIRNERSGIYANAPAGLYFRGDSVFPENGAAYNNVPLFAPRIGAVWDPSGDAKQTIRVGYGHFYNPPQTWHYSQMSRDAPWGNNIQATNPTSCPGKPSKNGCPIDFYDPWNATAGGDPHANFSHVGEPFRLPPSDAAFPLNAGQTTLPNDITPMNTDNWNVSYQRQLKPRLTAEVSYQGTSTNDMALGIQANPSVYIPGNCVAGQYGLTSAGPCSNTTAANAQARRYLTLINPAQGPYYAGISQGWFDGTSLYNGVKFTLSKRMADGWSASTNYTLSKCTSIGEPSTGVGNQFPIPMMDAVWPLVLAPETGPDTQTNFGSCSGDRRHNMNATGIFISPGVGSGFLKVLTRNWQVGLIFQARSGVPLTPSTTGDTALTGLPQRPILVPGVDPNLDPSERTWVENAAGLQTQLQWFNMAAFSQNGPGDWGNTPKGYLIGPSFWNADVSFSRNLGLANGRRIELRVEAFNLTNHVNWGNPNVTLGSATQGRVTTTNGNARIMQFAMKYTF